MALSDIIGKIGSGIARGVGVAALGGGEIGHAVFGRPEDDDKRAHGTRVAYAVGSAALSRLGIVGDYIKDEFEKGGSSKHDSTASSVDGTSRTATSFRDKQFEKLIELSSQQLFVLSDILKRERNTEDKLSKILKALQTPQVETPSPEVDKELDQDAANDNTALAKLEGGEHGGVLDSVIKATGDVAEGAEIGGGTSLAARTAGLFGKGGASAAGAATGAASGAATGGVVEGAEIAGGSSLISAQARAWAAGKGAAGAAKAEPILGSAFTKAEPILGAGAKVGSKGIPLLGGFVAGGADYAMHRNLGHALFTGGGTVLGQLGGGALGAFAGGWGAIPGEIGGGIGGGMAGGALWDTLFGKKPDTNAANSDTEQSPDSLFASQSNNTPNLTYAQSKDGGGGATTQYGDGTWHSADEAGGRHGHGRGLDGVPTLHGGRAATHMQWKDDPTNPLGALLQSGESGKAGYNAFNLHGGKSTHGEKLDLGGMTLVQIQQRQGKDFFAVGKYQFTPDTLKAAQKSLGLKGDEKFTPQLQEKIFHDYLLGTKRKAIGDFISGKSNNVDAAVKSLSEEWASVSDSKNGMHSHYEGKQGNHASISYADAVKALQAEKQIQSGGGPTKPAGNIQKAAATGPAPKPQPAVAVIHTGGGPQKHSDAPTKPSVDQHKVRPTWDSSFNAYFDLIA